MSKIQNTISIPLDVPPEAKEEYVKNMTTMTRGTGHISLFAGDQRVEHLNDDFHSEDGLIHEDDNDPEHLFRIASKAEISCLAVQLGYAAHYAASYPSVPLLIKLNSKSYLIKTAQKDPYSGLFANVEDVMRLKRNGAHVIGIGYTVYLGSEFEAQMFTEAARFIQDAHRHGLVTVLWVYPRGKAVPDEKDPHLIAGATGLAMCLGADVVKVNFPKKEGGNMPELFKEAVKSAGKIKVITAGGSSTDVRKFLQSLHDQIHISKSHGAATGRNIHQKNLQEAIRMCNAIGAIIFHNSSVDKAMEIYEKK